MGRAMAIFLAPPPGARGRGQKAKYHLISITKSISKIFLYQTLCVFSQMKDKKHIRRDFHSVGLIYKLKQHGIGGDFLKWLTDYLNGRQQKLLSEDAHQPLKLSKLVSPRVPCWAFFFFLSMLTTLLIRS